MFNRTPTRRWTTSQLPGLRSRNGAPADDRAGVPLQSPRRLPARDQDHGQQARRA
jgi:hypothetical protein